MNNVILIGRLTKDPDYRVTPQTNTQVVEFNLALDRGKDKDGNDKGADYPRVKAFGKTAENMQKFTHKGDMVAIIGRIQTGSYEKDGQKVFTTDILAERVEFLQKKNSTNGGQVPPADVPVGFTQIALDDIPF